MSVQRYFITLSYNGTNYHGWQIQPNGMSVEERLRQALSTLLRQSVETVGAGRTDAGVHARKMVVHFDYELSEEHLPASDLIDGQLIDCQQLVYRLNRLLPHDIAVHSVAADVRVVRKQAALLGLLLRGGNALDVRGGLRGISIVLCRLLVLREYGAGGDHGERYKRAERDNVQKFIIDTLKASTISVSEEFKELLPPVEESADTPVETPAEK